MLPHTLLPPHKTCLSEVSLQGFTGRREEQCVCLRSAAHNRSLWPTTAARSSELRGHCTAADGPRASGPSQPCPGHTPAASSSFLSTCSVRRQSRPCAPAMPRSSSFLGMGSSESHCSTSQLRAKERPLRSRGTPQIRPGPQNPALPPPIPHPPHLQPHLRVGNSAFCLLWPQTA